MLPPVLPTPKKEKYVLPWVDYPTPPLSLFTRLLCYTNQSNTLTNKHMKSAAPRFSTATTRILILSETEYFINTWLIDSDKPGSCVVICYFRPCHNHRFYFNICSGGGGGWTGMSAHTPVCISNSWYLYTCRSRRQLRSRMRRRINVSDETVSCASNTASLSFVRKVRLVINDNTWASVLSR